MRAKRLILLPPPNNKFETVKVVDMFGEDEYVVVKNYLFESRVYRPHIFQKLFGVTWEDKIKRKINEIQNQTLKHEERRQERENVVGKFSN